jgi:phosphoglucan,water dikinase
LLEATAERAGYKAASLGDVARVASRPASGFRALRGVTLPFGCFEACVREQGKQVELDNALQDVDAAVDAGDARALRLACDAARRVALSTLPPPDLAATVCASFVGEDIMGPDTYAESPNAGTLRSTTEVPLLAVRASHDVEDPACAGGDRANAFVDAFFAKHDASFDSDLGKTPSDEDGAGGFVQTLGGLSFGVTAARSRDVAEAVSAAWASAFTPEAVLRRRVAGVAGGHKSARVAVVVQPLAAGSVSFEVRTSRGSSGSDRDPTHTFVTLGPGFGGWSRDARAGEPFEVRVDTKDGAATTIAYASLETKRRVKGNVVVTEPVSYANEALGGVGAEAKERRENLARRLAAVGAVLEAEFGTPQLVEGCLVEDEVFVTRTRPRQP